MLSRQPNLKHVEREPIYSFSFYVLYSLRFVLLSGVSNLKRNKHELDIIVKNDRCRQNYLATRSNAQRSINCKRLSKYDFHPITANRYQYLIETLMARQKCFFLFVSCDLIALKNNICKYNPVATNALQYG